MFSAILLGGEFTGLTGTLRVVCNMKNIYSSRAKEAYSSEGYIPDRGVVVSVYTHPWNTVATREYLNSFEMGGYGPIFP